MSSENKTVSEWADEIDGCIMITFLNYEKAISVIKRIQQQARRDALQRLRFELGFSPTYEGEPSLKLQRRIYRTIDDLAFKIANDIGGINE